MLNGTYACVMRQNIGGGVIRRYGQLTLREKRGKLEGTMFPTMFWLDSPFTGGKISENTFSFTVHFSTPCQQFSMDVEGRVDGETLTGAVHSPMGDYVLEGTRQ